MKTCLNAKTRMKRLSMHFRKYSDAMLYETVFLKNRFLNLKKLPTGRMREVRAACEAVGPEPRNYQLKGDELSLVMRLRQDGQINNF